MSRHSFPSVFALPLAAALVVAGPAIASAQSAGTSLQSVASKILQQTTCTEYSYESQSIPGDAPCVFQSTPGGPWTSVTDCSGWVSFAIDNMLDQSFPIVPQAAGQSCAAITQNLQNYCSGLKAPTNPTTWIAALNNYRLAYSATESKINWPRAFVFTALASDLVYQPADQTKAKGAQAASAQFAAVTDMRTVQAGDVVSWCRGGWCNGIAGGGDTGHVMIINAPPAGSGTSYQCNGLPTLQSLPFTPPAGASVIGIPVIDSSGSHYPLVNASDGSPVFNAGRGFNGMQTGLGAGCIAVAITSAGLPIAHAMGGNWTTTMNLGTPIGQVYSGTDPSKLTDYTTVLRLK